MKWSRLLFIALLLGACHQTPQTRALEADIDSTQRAYQRARREFLLKWDSSKILDLNKDAAFLQRMSAAESRMVHIRQELQQKKSELHALRKGRRHESPVSVAR